MFNPYNKIVVDCYDDADFAALWEHKNLQGHICDRSRIGCVVTFSHFLLLWVSKLQTDIALFNLHSEYVVLYHSVRELLPLKNLIKEVIDKLGIDSEKLNFVPGYTLYEDNNGDISVATSPRVTTTSNHIYVSYYWFIQNVVKGFLIRKINSENHKADIFTKGLQGELFVRIRKLLCGW